MFAEKWTFHHFQAGVPSLAAPNFCASSHSQRHPPFPLLSPSFLRHPLLLCLSPPSFPLLPPSDIIFCFACLSEPQFSLIYPSLLLPSTLWWRLPPASSFFNRRVGVKHVDKGWLSPLLKNFRAFYLNWYKVIGYNFMNYYELYELLVKNKGQRPMLRPHEFWGISSYRDARELFWCYLWLCMPSWSFLYINSQFHAFFTKAWHTYRRTDRRTDGRTDGRTHPLIEMRGRI